MYTNLFSGKLHLLPSRMPFLSDSGYVGLGPSNAECGDLVCIFSGGRVPYVMRMSICTMTPHHAIHNPNPRPRSNAQSHPRIRGRKCDRDSIKHSQLIDRTGPKSLDSEIKLQLTTNYYSLTKQLLRHLTAGTRGLATTSCVLRDACS